MIAVLHVYSNSTGEIRIINFDLSSENLEILTVSIDSDKNYYRQPIMNCTMTLHVVASCQSKRSSKCTDATTTN
jgi:hypothetical protein